MFWLPCPCLWFLAVTAGLWLRLTSFGHRPWRLCLSVPQCFPQCFPIDGLMDSISKWDERTLPPSGLMPHFPYYINLFTEIVVRFGRLWCLWGLSGLWGWIQICKSGSVVQHDGRSSRQLSRGAVLHHVLHPSAEQSFNGVVIWWGVVILALK